MHLKPLARRPEVDCPYQFAKIAMVITPLSTRLERPISVREGMRVNHEDKSCVVNWLTCEARILLIVEMIWEPFITDRAADRWSEILWLPEPPLS